MITITKQDVCESVFNPCNFFIDNLPITGWVIDNDGIIISNEDGEGHVEWPLVLSETALSETAPPQGSPHGCDLQTDILSAFTQHTNKELVGRISDVLVIKGKGLRIDTLYAMLETEEDGIVIVYEAFGHPNSSWVVGRSLQGTLFTQTPV